VGAFIFGIIYVLLVLLVIERKEPKQQKNIKEKTDNGK